MQFFDKEANIADAISDAQSQNWICLSHAHLVDDELDALFQQLEQLPHLTEIDLSNNPLTDAGIRKVQSFCSQHPKINTLILNYIPMTEKSAIELLEVPTLQNLQFWNNKNIRDPFAQAVLQQHHVLELDIRDTGIGEILFLSANDHVRSTKEIFLDDTEEHREHSSYEI